MPRSLLPRTPERSDPTLENRDRAALPLEQLLAPGPLRMVTGSGKNCGGSEKECSRGFQHDGGVIRGCKVSATALQARLVLP